MPLAPGRVLGRFEILEPLGSGSMGEVYRARDRSLGREVALKVLPEQLAGDRELARLENEARAAAGLVHPNIVTVFGLERDGASLFMTMELAVGRSLRSLLANGPMTPAAALPIAVQLAEGLAAAHAKGVVHRDLKPENVVVTTDGVAKILDFGLAKVTAMPRHDDPTLRVAGLRTLPGTVLGTVGYMSPEQASGLPADHRSDQFSLGCVLYEMLAGRRPFHGATGAETMAAIIRDEPRPLEGADHEELADGLGWILERCLAKSPRERYVSTEDLARDLAKVKDRASRRRPAAPVIRTPRGALAVWALVVAAIGLATILGTRLRSPARGEPPSLRYLTFSGRDAGPAVSPDRHTIAFVSTRDGRQRIWLKQLDGGAEAPLTSGPADDDPRFTPDGAALVFSRLDGARRSLFRVPLLGGEPRRLLADARSGDPSPDGLRLAFLRTEPSGGGSGYVVGVAKSDGGEARALARLDAIWATPPRWSPDGRWIAVGHGAGASPRWSTLLLSADGRQRVEVPPPARVGALSTPVFSPSGAALLYAQAPLAGGAGRLVRQDARSGRSETLLRLLTWGPTLDLAGPGGLVFDARLRRASLREIDLHGDPSAARWLTHGASVDRQPAYTSDGGKILFSSDRDGNLEVWELSTRTGEVRRLTENSADDWDPHPMRNGKLLWSSKRTGNFEIWMAEADGSEARQVTHDGVDAENPAATPAGDWIVYASFNPKSQGIWKVRSDGTEPTLLAPGNNNGLPEVSPDGALVLFTSFVPNNYVIRVVRLSDGAAIPFQIALGPPNRMRAFARGRCRWTPDGSAIAFLDVDGNGSEGIYRQAFVPGRDTSASRRPLAGFDPGLVTESFAFSPDGERLTVSALEEASQLLAVDGLTGIDR